MWAHTHHQPHLGLLEPRPAVSHSRWLILQPEESGCNSIHVAFDRVRDLGHETIPCRLPQ